VIVLQKKLPEMALFFGAVAMAGYFSITKHFHVIGFARANIFLPNSLNVNRGSSDFVQETHSTRE
jgi:hypothetical protein